MILSHRYIFILLLSATVLLAAIPSRIAGLDFELVKSLHYEETSPRSIAFDPAGEYLAIVRRDNLLSMLPLGSDSIILLPKEHDDEILDVAFSPDTTYIATVDYDFKLVLWRLQDLTFFDRDQFATGSNQSLSAVAFCPTGRSIACGSSKGEVMYGQTRPLRLPWRRDRHRRYIYDLEFDPRGRYFVTGSADSTVQLHFLDNERRDSLIIRMPSSVLALAVSPSGKYIASAGADGAVFVSEIETGVSRQFGASRKVRVRALDFSPDENWIAVGADDRLIKIHNHTNPSHFISLGEFKGSVNDVEFSANGLWFACTSGDSSLRVWSVRGMGERVVPDSVAQPEEIPVSPDRDMEGPQIVVTEPRFSSWNSTTAAAERLVLRGWVKDESGVRAFRVNDESIPLRGYEFSKELRLQYGNNFFRLRAKDGAGNIAEVNYLIKRDTLEFDDDPPEIEIFEPKLDADRLAEIKARLLRVAGIARDRSGVDSVLVGGVPAALDDSGRFESEIMLEDRNGVTAVKVEAIDAAVEAGGNRGVYTFTVNSIVEKDVEGPMIEVLEPNMALFRAMKKIDSRDALKITGRAADPSGVEEVTVYVEDDAYPCKLSADGQFSVVVNVKLGYNDVQVAGTDRLGNRTRPPKQFAVHRKLEAPALAGIPDRKFYALVIGISKYKNPAFNLDCPVNDGRAIAQLLKEKYRFERVDTLFDEQATRQGIGRALDRMADWVVGENDCFLLYYAGHGDREKDGTATWWVPYDAETRSNNEGLEVATLITNIKKIKSYHTLVLADNCFSGLSLTRSVPTEAEPGVDSSVFRKYYLKKSRKGMTSGAHDEPVLDRFEGTNHSAFAHIILKTLRNNDRPFLSGSDLSREVNSFFAMHTKSTPQYFAIRETGDDDGEFFFLLPEGI